MRTREEMESMLSRAHEAEAIMPSRMNYLEGVIVALEWALGDIDESVDGEIF